MFAYHCSLKFWWASRGKRSRLYGKVPQAKTSKYLASSCNKWLSVFRFCWLVFLSSQKMRLHSLLHHSSLVLSCSFLYLSLASCLWPRETPDSCLRETFCDEPGELVGCLSAYGCVWQTHRTSDDRWTRCFPSAGCMSGGLGDKGSCDKTKKKTQKFIHPSYQYRRTQRRQMELWGGRGIWLNRTFAPGGMKVFLSNAELSLQFPSVFSSLPTQFIYIYITPSWSWFGGEWWMARFWCRL